jgi:nicotinamide-nucleotide amidase
MVVDLVSGANPTVAPYAKLGEVHLRVTASAASVEEAEALMAPVITEIERRLGSHLYAFDDELLEAAVVRMLSARNLTVAVAESCTGGLLGARLTDVAGSSAVFLGGVVAYSNAAKQTIVGVPPDVIETHGAVSPETAAALAEGARDRFGASFGVGITGIAGPDGGSAEKPVGTVHIAVADRREVTRQANRYLGSRADVRRRATQSALTLLRDLVIDVARG